MLCAEDVASLIAYVALYIGTGYIENSYFSGDGIASNFYTFTDSLKIKNAHYFFVSGESPRNTQKGTVYTTLSNPV
jgi:hypothetical protein